MTPTSSVDSGSQQSDILMIRHIQEYRHFFWHPTARCKCFDETAHSRFVFSQSNPVEVVERPEGWLVKSDPGCVTETPKPPPTTFLEYLRTLDEWEADLFAGVEFNCKAEELRDALFTEEFQLECSDGSVIHEVGSFAWILGPPEKPTVRCTSPVYGYRTTSFRAEAYGVLSFLRLAYRITVWLDCGSTLLLAKPHLDSYSVSKRIHSYIAYHHLNGNSRLHSDWDVIHEIYVTSKLIDFEHLIWVRSHQDQTEPYQKLKPIAQLNELPCIPNDVARR